MEANKKVKFHCLFEQSGTFKNEFKKLGYEAEDYDILNDFNQTDHVIDLFEEIEIGYKNLHGERERESIFDKMSKDDQVLAFFPCVRFEVQIEMAFRGQARQQAKWSDSKKLEYDLKLHEELHNLYNLITKLALILLDKGIPLILENPYSPTHYLTKYWAIPCSFIDYNRRDRGDYYNKPTQYWFIGRKPSNNFIFEAQTVHPKKVVDKTPDKAERSLISPEYANRFIREFILEGEEKQDEGLWH